MLSRTLLVFAAALAALIAANETAAHSQPDGDAESARRAAGSTVITQRVETGTSFGQYSKSNVPAVLGCDHPHIFGNVWDDREVNELDALWLLRKIGGIPLPFRGVPCAPMDINCDGKNDTLDALQILRWVAGLPTNHEEGCPEIGTPYGPYS